MKLNQGFQKKITLAAMCIATFIAILDTTVVNLALNAIQGALGASVNVLQWVVDSYTLIYASFILTGGALGDLFGRRRIFVSRIILFTIGSLMCAMAPDTAWLIAGRCVAGFGAALELPVALSILTVTFEAAERSRAVAVWMGFNGLAMAVGPTAGGFLIDHFSWRSIFYLVVPFGVLALVLTFIGLAESSDPKDRKIDWPGQLFAVLTLGTLAFGLIEGPVDSWKSPLIIGSLLICVAGFIAFLFVESRERNGLVSLDVFQNSAFSAAIATTMLTTFCFYGLLFVFPLYLQKVRRASALWAGIELLPLSLTFFGLSFIAGSLLEKFGPRLLIGIGMTACGAGMFILAFLGAAAAYASIVPGLLLMGGGLAMISGPLMTVAVSSVAKERSGMSSGLVNVARMVGATLGVAILGLIFSPQEIQTAAGAEFLGDMRTTLSIGGSAAFAGAIIAFVFIKGKIRKES